MKIGNTPIPSNLFQRSWPPENNFATWSSLVFVLGIYIPAQDFNALSIIVATMMVLTGISSALWHASEETWAQRLDEWAMSGMMVASIGHISSLLLTGVYWNTVILVITGILAFWKYINVFSSFYSIPIMAGIILVLLIVGDASWRDVGFASGLGVVTWALQFAGERSEHGTRHSFFHITAFFALFIANIALM